MVLDEDPNQLRSEHEQVPELGIKDTFRELMKNTNLLILASISGILQGIFNTFGTVAGELLSAAGYADYCCCICGALYIGGGVVGAAIYGCILSKTQAYKKAMISQCIASIAVLICFMCFFSFQNCWIAGVLCFSMGFASIPSIVIAVDLGAEITYPTNESFSTGIIMICGQFFSVVIIIFTSSILDKTAKVFACDITFIILAICALIALYLCKPLKEDLIRTAFEQEVK